MSVQGLPVSASVPAVNQALEPEWVRRGSPATKQAYESALAFEQTLVEQLSKSLTAASGLGGESSAEGEASSEEGASADGAGVAELSSLLPQALSSGVMNAGGLGLAAQMTGQLEGVGGAARAGGHEQALASGGTAPGDDAGAAVGPSGGSAS
jgi:hypothetical protein